MREAFLYEKLGDQKVRCSLCAHRCHIEPDKFGFCGVRQNIGGKLFTHAYGKVIVANVDPIEKKPLYHFLPGSKSFSIATLGCNFRCGFCQNWEISQASFRVPEVPGGGKLSPAEIVKLASENKCASISYTYTEPTIFFEYAYETAGIARGKGLLNNFVTNGFMTAEALKMIRPFLDAANVDLKFFKDSSYKRICLGSLQPVLDTICLMKELGVWVEVTTLVVPGVNDSPEELTGIAGFLAGLDKNIPWHLSRFHPDYNFTDQQATPAETLRQAGELGRAAGLNYVYIGNLRGEGNHTHCQNCRKLLIKREGFSLLEYNIEKGKCPDCGNLIPGRF